MFFIGHGIDQHKLVKRKKIIVIGGYKMQSEWSILAHSDGDIVLHSISNAILGALGKGDIGDYFPDSDKFNKNLDSQKILKKALMFLKNKKIVNIDLTIICEDIFFGNHKNNIKKSLEKILPCKHINVKCTRFEKATHMICCESILLIHS